MYTDRYEAGRRLAPHLGHLAGEDLVVLGLPRGGVPVAYEVAKALDAPLDVIIVRKLGVPHQPELAMGALGEDGVRVVDHRTIRTAGITQTQFDRVERAERGELGRRALAYRSAIDRVDLEARTALIIDDGFATGSTARAAARVASLHGARRVVLSAPVAPTSTVDELSDQVDEVVVDLTPEPFRAIGLSYVDFSPTSDEQVRELLAAR